jgi:hypothetical protein
MGGLALSTSCSSALGTMDAGPNPYDASPLPEAGADAAISARHWPAMVLVDGLVNGTATDTTGAAITLGDVRVCIFDSTGTTPLTQYAKPDDTPMPLANYPGARRGGGVDLGSFLATTPTTVTIDVFRAADLAGDAVWQPKRAAYTCTNISCDTGSLPCVPHARFSATLDDDVNVIGLVDGTSGVEAHSSFFPDKPFNGAPGSIYGGVVNFTGFGAGSSVSATYADLGDAGSSTGGTLISVNVTSDASAPVPVTSTVASYDGDGIRFDATDAGASFSQSLDSIGYVTNPTLDPPTFWSVRANFVFALVGDPNDPTSVLSNGGRDPAFDGRGLHVTAIPYASPEPQ